MYDTDWLLQHPLLHAAQPTEPSDLAVGECGIESTAVSLPRSLRLVEYPPSDQGDEESVSNCVPGNQSMAVQSPQHLPLPNEELTEAPSEEAIPFMTMTPVQVDNQPPEQPPSLPPSPKSRLQTNTMSCTQLDQSTTASLPRPNDTMTAVPAPAQVNRQPTGQPSSLPGPAAKLPLSSRRFARAPLYAHTMTSLPPREPSEDYWETSSNETASKPAIPPRPEPVSLQTQRAASTTNRERRDHKEAHRRAAEARAM
jgi:hypothetical protein